jgi:hypothetical protein
VDNVTPWDKKNYFKVFVMNETKISFDCAFFVVVQTFMEDFNTVTLPSEKYYNLAAWELKEAKKQAKQKEKERKKARKKALKYGDSEVSVFNDEEARRLEKKMEREQKQDLEYKQHLLDMSSAAVEREHESMKKILQGSLGKYVCCWLALPHPHSLK